MDVQWKEMTMGQFCKPTNISNCWTWIPRLVSLFCLLVFPWFCDLEASMKGNNSTTFVFLFVHVYHFAIWRQENNSTITRGFLVFMWLNDLEVTTFCFLKVCGLLSFLWWNNHKVNSNHKCKSLSSCVCVVTSAMVVVIVGLCR
jgi:hypothetical protein